MRQVMGEKKIRRLAERFGIDRTDINFVLTRGNTGHRIDIHMVGGQIKSVFPNGEIKEWNLQEFLES